MRSGLGWSVKTHWPPRASGGATHIEPTSHESRPGQARPIMFLQDRTRPGPAHHVSSGWDAASPGPYNDQRIGRGPARPLNNSENWPRNRRSGSHFHMLAARLGQARRINFSNVSARPISFPENTAGPGPARHKLMVSQPGSARTNGRWQALCFFKTLLVTYLVCR